MSFRPPDASLLPWSPGHSISTARAMEILDVSHSTLLRLIEDGSLKAYKMSNRKKSHWRICYDSVVAHLEGVHERNGLDKRF